MNIVFVPGGLSGLIVVKGTWTWILGRPLRAQPTPFHSAIAERQKRERKNSRSLFNNNLPSQYFPSVFSRTTLSRTVILSGGLFSDLLRKSLWATCKQPLSVEGKMLPDTTVKYSSKVTYCWI